MSPQNVARTIVIDVPDMSCGHCVSHLEQALKAVPGVRDVTVSLDTKSAEVDAEPDLRVASLEQAIDEAGYTPSNPREV